MFANVSQADHEDKDAAYTTPVFEIFSRNLIIPMSYNLDTQ